MTDWLFICTIAFIVLGSLVFLIYPLKSTKTMAVINYLGLLVLIVSAYAHWGSFSQWQQEKQVQKSQHQAREIIRALKSPQQLISQLKARLDEEPKRAKGWYLLGRLYLTQNEVHNAANAFAKAHQLAYENEQYTVNYAQSLWTLNKQQFNPQIRALFTGLLKNNPNQPDALAMLAMNSFLTADYAQAINYWQRLLKLAPPASKEAFAIRKAIAQAEERINNAKEK